VSTLLRVDLCSGVARTEPAPDRRGTPGFGLLGVSLLLAETPPHLDVYHPDQPVVFGVGAVAGRRTLALPRFSIVAKSPLSGGIAESRVEGPFGPALRDTGHDAVVLTGRSREPSYVLVEPSGVRVLDATDLWGLDVATVTDRLVARHGGDAHVAAIGPAGEHLVRFASVVADRGYTARGGLGAMLGAKNCKALVVVGDAQPPVASRLTVKYASAMGSNPLTTTQHEPPGFGSWPAEGLEGYLGVRNYSTARASLPGFTPDEFVKRLGRSTGGCPGCPQDCLKSFGPDDSGVLHQEAVAAFAGMLGIADLDTVLELNIWCHNVGVDPVSLAGVLAFHCELGNLSFGDADALRKLAEDVIHRTGPGALLADGVARAAAALGSQQFALHSKGIEVCGFDPRGSPGLALAYAVHPLGPRYDGVEHDIDFDPDLGHELFISGAREMGCPPAGLPMTALTDEKVRLVANLMELWSGYDAVGLCLFAAPPTRALTEHTAAELVSAVTGWDVSPAELRALGRRRLSLMREYNLREGLTSADDVLPDRFFTLPVDAGLLEGAVLDRPAFEAATRRLRELLGWDS